MAGKDIIKMSTRELKRLHIIRKVINREFTQKAAAGILGLCTRQIGRITTKVKKEGDRGIIHKSRGRPSNRAKPAKLKNKILKLCRSRYKGFGPTFASEKLFEIDEIIINPETLRLWFKGAGIDYKSRKHKKHRHWRERMHHFGEMTQIDGSHHDWFEGRAPECVLMGYIDDATNTVFARFYEYEGTFPAMDSFKRYIKRYGIPYSIYIDKHSTYKSMGRPSIEDQLNNTNPLSQFERALEELTVEVIHANSPQAKGRVERLFQTFQDRLIKEMRLRKIKSIQQANSFLRYYLPVFNRRFGIKPLERADFHRPLSEAIDLDKILCVKTERTLRNDLTIAHNKQLYQVLDKTSAKKVTVQERINGTMLITYKGKTLKYKQIQQRPPKPQRPKTFKTRQPRYAPPKDHYYRRFIVDPYNSYLYKEKQRQEQDQNQEQKEPLLTT